MRIRRLLFVLALILSGGATPVHAAVGVTPRCLPPVAMQGAMDTVDAKLPIPELRQAVPTYDPEERDYLIRTIAFEAADESDEGKVAVAHVILNRKRSGIWGDNIKDVVTHPWQFEPWMTRRTEMEKLSPDDPRYQDAARIADAVLSGQMPDPTAGATHFLNPTIVRRRRGGSLPSWALGEGQPIGRHTFYSPHKSDAAPQLAALSLSALEDPPRFDHSPRCQCHTDETVVPSVITMSASGTHRHSAHSAVMSDSGGRVDMRNQRVGCPLMSDTFNILLFPMTLSEI